MKKTWTKYVVAVVVLLGVMTAFSAFGSSKAYAKTTTNNFVVRKGSKYMFTAQMKGKINWSVDNKKILKIYKKKNGICYVKMLKEGKAILIAKSKRDKYKFKLTIRSGDAFVKAWCRQWVKDNIRKDMNFKDKLILASAYVVSTNFQYGNASKPEDVITNGVGTCVSGSKLVAAMCQAMGYKAKVRFAAEDNMSRYPAGVVFMKQHYNVEVTVKGRKYYIDGTPGTMGVYLSTKKEPLFWGFAIKDRIVSPDEFMNIPAWELF